MGDTHDQLDSLREGLEHLKAQHEGAAVDSSSVKTGVTNDEKFETAASEIHGYGKGDFAKIDVRLPSTPGENFDAPRRAGEMYDGQGEHPDPPMETVWDSKTGEARQRYRTDYYDRNDSVIVAGKPDEIIDEREESDSPIERLIAEPPGGRPQHEVNYSGESVPDGGGGGSGRRHKKQGTIPVCVDCHLQNCVCNEDEDGKPVRRRGRKRRYEDEALETYRVHVRPSDVQTIKDAGLKFSQVAEREIARIAECLRTGKTWDEVEGQF